MLYLRLLIFLLIKMTCYHYLFIYYCYSYYYYYYYFYYHYYYSYYYCQAELVRSIIDSDDSILESLGLAYNNDGGANNKGFLAREEEFSRRNSPPMATNNREFSPKPDLPPRAADGLRQAAVSTPDAPQLPPKPGCHKNDASSLDRFGGQNKVSPDTEPDSNVLPKIEVTADNDDDVADGIKDADDLEVRPDINDAGSIAEDITDRSQVHRFKQINVLIKFKCF